MKTFLLSTLISFLFLIETHGIEFEYYGTPLNTECFGEALNENTLMIGEVRSSLTNIAVKLFDPNGKMLFSKSNETISKFSVTAQIQGTFQVCVDNLSRQFLNYVVKIETGVFAKDYSEMAKTNNVKPIEIILKKTEDMMSDIKSTTTAFIHKKEEYIDKLDFVNLKIMIFSVITIVIMVILGFLQVNYLKNFYKSKK